jgi:hypothetical protein
MKIPILILSILALFLLDLSLQSCGRTAECPLCNREVHEHMGVKITHNSLPMKTCCMSCALTYRAQEKNVEIVSATDFLTDAPIAPESAFYVVASDVSPCMQDPKVQKVIREQHQAMYACYDRCEPSILAFSKKADAQTFQQEHGGHLEQFAGLMKWLPVKGGHQHDR